MLVPNCPDSTVTFKSLSFLGYPKYAVGDDGSVWSHAGRRKEVVWMKLRQYVTADGYRQVNLGYPSKSLLVHRLVLLAFVGPQPHGMEACHNDGVRHNNVPSNLRWDTHGNNVRDRAKHGTTNRGISINRGEAHPLAKLSEADVKRIRDLYATGEYTQKAIGEMYGVTQGLVGMIVRRVIWGYVA